MKFVVSIICLQLIANIVAAQLKETFDATTYTAPKGWKKETKVNLVVYTITNKKDTSWCQIGVYRSTESKGAIETDFNESWTELAARPYKIEEAPHGDSAVEADGWKIKSGAGKFIFNKAPAMVLLTTFTGYGKSIAIMAVTNKQRYTNDIAALLGSIELNKTVVEKTPADAASNAGTVTTTSTPGNTNANAGGYAFTTTNFDDGWVGTVQEDWVAVTKGNTKVLLHYPKEGTIFPADPEPLTNAAWNILVAPRYSNLKNYKTTYIATFNRPYLGMGYATENKTGKEVFVLLFRQGEGWIEFITPDKNTFIQQYKFDPETIKWDSNSDLMNPLANMKSYNKFAVATSDFKGKWTSDFTGIQQLYNVYTGDYAGMHMNQSNEEFVFGNAGTYNWKLLVVNGMAGNAKFTEVKSAGQLTVVHNWQIHCSKIESGPKTYNAFWSCIKGARILNLLDAQSPGSGIYTKYGLAK
ncbi:hypothetical protein QWZ08_08180 [Ferruginibacter paludis]|uniref:hypothetical protein n=1 Tax=Ferruginibacter paludis TaxID=1310417 RepID=UPI0025B340C5|nr:hypothetical protein [Ferruginibacter paludis]MDN3655599.1 hypothetical protein [Ferruginibacter paludis]